MYVLDWTRQIFVSVTFLMDNATKPVESAAEVRQPIQTSNLFRLHEFNAAEMRRTNRA